MKTQSAKAKGRRAQQLVAEALTLIGDLEEGDCVSTSMGANGVDVKLSPAAKRRLGDWATEVKNVERLDVNKVFAEHAAKYQDRLPVLIHTKNHSEVLVTVKFSTWLALLRAARVDGV